MKKKIWRYYHFTNVCHKWQSYNVWFVRYGVQQKELFVILECFLPFYPPNNPKNQSFEKTKKPLEDITILHRCNINDNHIMYGSWDTKCNRQNYLSFWIIFCPFNPLTTWNQNFEKLKKPLGDIITFHMCTINDSHMMYCFWVMEHEWHNFFVILDHFLLFYPPEIRILKK